MSNTREKAYGNEDKAEASPPHPPGGVGTSGTFPAHSPRPRAGGKPSRGERDLRAVLRTCSHEVHGLAARLRAAKQFDEYELATLKQSMKWAMRVADSELAGALAFFEKWREDLGLRVSVLAEDPELISTAPLEPSPARAKASATRTKKRWMRKPVTSAVPPTGVRNGRPCAEQRGPDGLTDKQLEELGLRRRVARLINEDKLTAREALKETHLEGRRTLRWAQKVAKRSRDKGTVRDGRRGVPHPSPVMTPEIVDLVMKWWYGRPAAGPKTVHRLALQDIKALREETAAIGFVSELREPSYAAVWRYLDRLPEAVKLTRTKRGLKAWDKQGRPRVQYNPTTYANELWEIDHQMIKVWVRSREGGEWVPKRPWLTSTIDVYSGASPGRLVTIRHPDAWSTALTMRNSILSSDDPEDPIEGAPDAVKPDWGADFKSHEVAAGMSSIGTRLEFCHPHDPDGKPHVERFHHTINEGLYKALPGHIDAIGHSEEAARKHIGRLLTVAQVRREIERWVRKVYHRTENSETGEPPLDRWQRTARIRRFDARELDVLLLHSTKERRITANGIRFMRRKGKGVRRGGYYWCPALITWWKATARLRYNPEDLRSVLVYDSASGEYIGEAWRMDGPDARYTKEDVMEARHRMRKGLSQRMRDYSERVDAEDRERVEAWDKAAANARRLESEDPNEADIAARAEADTVKLTNMKRRRPTAVPQRASAERGVATTTAPNSEAEKLAALKRREWTA
jgi:hypothetical protein